MANPFGDEPVGSADGPGAPGGTPNPFGDAPVKRDGYLAASGKAALQDAKGAAATLIDAVLPTTSEADLAVLFKNDPAGLKKMQDESVNSVYQRIAKNASAKADAIMAPENLTPEAQAQSKLEYATTDTGNAAWADPTKVAGDVLRSAPSSALMMGTMLITKGAGQRAFAQAKAAGATEAAATSAAMRASAQTLSTTGAVSEGALGGAQNYNETQAQGEKMTQEQWDRSPAYQALLAKGYDPEVAKTIATQQAARESGIGAGLADAAVNAVGGQYLGKVLGEGGKVAKRTGAAMLEQGVTEAIQSPLEKVSENAAIQRYFDPKQDLLKGTGEAAVAGGVVGAASGAPMGIVGGQKHASETGAKMLDGAANDLDLETATGFSREAAKTVADVSGQASQKPKLNGLQSRVALEAQRAGVDVPTALAVMQLESGGRDVNNPKSSAGGLFQIIDSTWESLGGGDRADEATQIRNGVKYLAQIKETLRATVGQEPTPAETYMGHMLGPGGAKALIMAQNNAPDEPFINTVRKWDSKNADAIVGNNRFTGMTNRQVYDSIAGRVLKESQRLGLDADLNRIVQVSPLSDAVPNTTNLDDSFTEELNAMLSEDELSPMSADELTQASIEEGFSKTSQQQQTEEHNQLDAAFPLNEAAPVEEPKLPTELAGANPRYGFGANNLFNLSFESDLDKAAFIASNEEKKSVADSRYLDFVMQNTGMTLEEARAYGRDVAGQIKELARANKDKGIRELSITSSRTSLPDSFVSIDEAGTRKRYANPNDRVALTNTPIAAASDPTLLGETLRTRKLQPGEVVALNIEGAHTPQAYVEAVQGTLQDWVSRFMPQSTVIASFRSMSAAQAAQWSLYKRLGRTGVSKVGQTGAVHVLNLRNATNLGVTDDGTANPSTQRKIAYSMAHEFGHALAEEQFKQGMSDELAAKFDNLGEEEFFTEQDLASMPADTASVLREYNELKRRVLTDPKMTARDFINQWLSPWKTAHGRDSKRGIHQGAESFAKMYLGESRALMLDKVSAATLGRQMNDPDTRILSPHEYMAEQFSRYAYSRQLFKNSPFDTVAFFARTFESLAKFFKSIKSSGVAEPGVKFADWVDSLTAAGKNEKLNNEAMPAAEITQPRKASAKPRLRSAPATSTAVPQQGSTAVDQAAAESMATVHTNIGGRDVGIAPAAGNWYQVDRQGNLVGESLGKTQAEAVRALAVQFRSDDARAASAKTARQVYAAKPAAPSILPPPVPESQMAEATGQEYTSEQQKMAEHILRTDPMMKELRGSQPELFAELRDLVRAGKLEEFRFEVSQYVADDVADKMRWDHDNPEHMTLREVQMNIENALPSNTGLKRFFGEGLRRLSNAKYYTMTMTQIAYANPFSGGLQHFNNMKNQFKTFKARLEFRAVANAMAWSKLGKEQRGLLERALRQEHFNGTHMFDLQQVNKTWRFVPNEETQTYANKHKLDDSTVKLWLDVKNSYLQHMNVLQNTLLRKLQERMSDRPALMKKKAHEINAMFKDIRSQPFLPQTRFGEFAIQIREIGVEGNRLIHVDFFESASDRDAAIKELASKLQSNQRIMPAKYSPTSAILRTLPPQILSTYAEEFQLTDLQRKELREIADAVTRNQQTRKYSSQLAEISGANKNLLKNYADFMSHDSNNISKLFYRDEFNKAVNQMEQEQQMMAEEGDFAGHDEQRKLIEFAKSYKDHILNPAQEYHMLRSFVVMKMLWGNVKTALANLNSMTQLFALAARQQGTISGVAVAGKMSAKVLSDSVQNLGRRVIGAPVKGGEVFTADERWALNLAKVNGLLDETFAAQLASFSGNSTLDRLNAPGPKSLLDQVAKFGMIPQHAVENYTRRVTLLNQFNNYRKEGMSQKEAFDAAQTDLYLLQGDNTQANRPAFMRGKASAFFIFYGYMQNMLYLMSGAQERSRNKRIAIEEGVSAEEVKRRTKIDLGGETLKMWMGYAMLGGLMGLPGAEDLDKILGLVARSMFGKDFSLKDYAFQLGHTISNGAAQLGLDVNPRSIVHGSMSDINMFGLLPGLDVSPSMSLGAALPGLGGVDKLDKRGGSGDFLIGMLGPLGSLFKDLGKAFSDDPSMLNRMGLVMPNTAKAWAKAIDEHRNGVLYPSGGKVTFDRKSGEIRDLTNGETLSRLMGFTPTIISSNKELHWMQKDKADFWTARRNLLTAQMWEAHKQGDREAEADVREAVREFNATADPKVKLTHAEIAASMKKRQANAKRDTSRTAAAKRYRGMYKEMEEEFRGARSQD